jgi:tetratricopeptide (TPR) repeat protein
VSVNQLLTPNKAQRATEKAREDLIHGRFESAQREAELALDIFPRCAIALDIQGVANLRRANYADAAREFQRAIDADPALGAAWVLPTLTRGALKRLSFRWIAQLRFCRAHGPYTSKPRSLIWVSENLTPLSKKLHMRSDSWGLIRRRG